MPLASKDPLRHDGPGYRLLCISLSGTHHMLPTCRLGTKATTQGPLLVLDAGFSAAAGAPSPPHRTTSVLHIFHLLQHRELSTAHHGSGRMLLAVLVYTGSQPTGIPVSLPTRSRCMALDCLPFLVCLLAVFKQYYIVFT